MEPKLFAFEMTAREANWLKGLLSESTIIAKQILTTLIYSDNQQALAKVRKKKHNCKFPVQS